MPIGSIAILTSICIAAWCIYWRMGRIADALEKIARNSTREIRIIPGPKSKDFRIILPNDEPDSGPTGRKGAQ